MSHLKNKLQRSPQIWLLYIGESDYNKNELTPPKWFSVTEKQRFKRIKAVKRQIQFIKSRALIRHALSQNFHKPFDWWLFQEKRDSQPLVENLPDGIQISLSHSHNWVVVALGNSSLGIDIEHKKPRNFIETSKIFMTEQELAGFDNNPSNSDFYRTWCLKEAFYKAFPSRQNNLNIQQINTLDIYNEVDSSVIELENPEYKLTLYTHEIIDSVNCYISTLSQQDWQQVTASEKIPANWISFEL